MIEYDDEEKYKFYPKNKTCNDESLLEKVSLFCDELQDVLIFNDTQ